MLIASYRDNAYDFVLVLHILTVVIGLGAVFLDGVYGAQIKARRGPEGLAIAEANFTVTKLAEWFVYTIPVFGVALVFMSDDVIKFDETWVWLSLLLYIVALGLSHGMLMPTVKRMHVLMKEMIEGPPPVGGPPPQAAEMEKLGKRLGAVRATFNLLVVVIIVLMVFKPGSPL